jgi:TRAP-type C4-dicarboxylate transport system permease small subunit
VAEHHISEIGPSSLRARLERWTEAIALIGFSGLGLIAILTFYDGAARYLDFPRVAGFSDYAQVSYPVVIASCFPALLLRGHNITIRFLGRALGLRATGWLETFGALLTLIFFAVIVWQFILLAADFQANNRTTRTVEMQVAPWWWVTTALMALTIPVQAYVLLSNLSAAWSGRDPIVRDQVTSEA